MKGPLHKNSDKIKYQDQKHSKSDKDFLHTAMHLSHVFYEAVYTHNTRQAYPSSQLQ